MSLTHSRLEESAYIPHEFSKDPHEQGLGILHWAQKKLSLLSFELREFGAPKCFDPTVYKSAKGN
jgi:hypothetical protein